MGFTQKNNMYNKIPDELKALPNWVCWQASPDPKAHSGISKKPVNPKTGGLAASNGPSTWADYETALKASARFSGLGFMFGGSGFFGVDIDDEPEALAEYLNGSENNIFGEFLKALNSYAEISYSGSGIHIICRGSLPPGGRKRTEKPKLEMYDSGRFFVMTGNAIGGYDKLSDGGEAIKRLHSKYFPKPEPEPAQPSAPQPVSLSEAEILEKASNAKNGAEFSRLWSGDISSYGSHSEADLALCNILAFWCGADPAAVDSMFRKSGLMREKWDKKRGGVTYGQITVQKAVSGCREVYSPGAKDFKIKFTGGEPKKMYRFDDMGNAERFIDLSGNKIRYCYIEKKWYFYNGQKWAVDTFGEVERLSDRAVAVMEAETALYENDEEMLKQFQKHIKTSRSNRAKKAMLAEAQHHVPVAPKQLDKHKFALNTPGGVINLKKGTVGAHNPELYLTKITAVSPAEKAECPLWLKFLDDIFDGDKDLIRYVQKAVGYSLTGSTKEQCAFFLFGTGRNGKSTFLDVIRDVMGDYATNIQPETIMIKPAAGTASSDIARLKGARFVTSVEPNEGVRLNEGLLKQLTGDDIVTARKLYSEEFEFKPEFKLWMATNHKPVVRGTDTGIWRRIHMIPFTVAIPPERVDRNLPFKLRAELPSIMRWALDGCALWQAEGLKMPRAVLACVREYRREMDVISAFLDDCCAPEGSVSAKTLYAAYCQWADDNNEYRMSNTKFGSELSKRFERVHSRNGKYYNGISLSSEL